MIIMSCIEGLDPYIKSQSKITKYYLPSDIKTIQQAMYWFDTEIAIPLMCIGLMEADSVNHFYKPITIDGKEYDYEYLFEFEERTNGSRKIKYISQFYDDMGIKKEEIKDST